ncbi:hypothetical protein DFP72DRAFT_860346 [Ephemerocybe angulata]|uniref:F-box domain-containing protein n=1 Tax=Ephemerocybe angulata TaxID=980116 RepID=A0A8H6HB09_9AGAR|nr:hypothetical protein DFP72DRAFT_860346 [Tulosesus angulatus]
MTTYARPGPPPIDTLPVELLSYIFTLGTHSPFEPSQSNGFGDEPEGIPAFNSENVKTPLVLASVSRYWRRVVLNTPSLWTSLCITLEMVQPSEGSSAPSTFDTTHITSYLTLSRRYPIDILIDARDPDWDFQEDGVTPDSYSYKPQFSVEHMQTVISLLLPHLSRWRSMNILTDTWKPMQSALQSINPAILRHGAPRLESLSLMRCNDFVSFSPEFEPKSLKDTSFLSTTHSTPSSHSTLILPRLSSLSLRGVHVDWASLSAALSSSRTGLYSLELCSHCSDVRPSISEFHRLLYSNPRLRNLVVSGSGPSFPADVDEGLGALRHEFDGAFLPNLTKLTLGYRSVLEGQTILELVNAPNLKSLVLEEATYPADPEVVDAGSLLTYLGTGEFHNVKERYLAAYDGPDGCQYQPKTRKDSTASTSTCVGSGLEIGGRLIEDDEDDVTLVDFDTKPHPPFSLLENLSLKTVRSSSTQPISSMFGAMNNLRRLELVGMSMRPLYTLLPDSFPTPNSRSRAFSPSAPGVASSSTLRPPISQLNCPQLRSLSLQDCNEMQVHDLTFILNKLVSDRKAHGSCTLEDIDIQLGPNAPLTSYEINLQEGAEVSSMVDVVDAQPSYVLEKDGVRIQLRRASPAFGDEYDDDEEMDEGSVFNDPYFDAYYTGAAWLSGR